MWVYLLILFLYHSIIRDCFGLRFKYCALYKLAYTQQCALLNANRICFACSGDRLNLRRSAAGATGRRVQNMWIRKEEVTYSSK
jgi:hypothetical protein